MMKKLFFITILFSATFTFTQQNNTWVFSGELGLRYDKLHYTQNNLPDNNTKQLQILGRVGYIFTNSNFEIGLGIGFGSSESTSIFSNTKDKYKNISFRPYAKQYFTINDKFAFHLIGELGFSKVYLDNTNGNDEIDIQELGIVFRPGFVYFVTKHFALTANLGSLGYISTTSKYKFLDDRKNESFGFNFNGSNILFGVAYYL